MVLLETALAAAVVIIVVLAYLLLRALRRADRISAKQEIRESTGEQIEDLTRQMREAEDRHREERRADDAEWQGRLEGQTAKHQKKVAEMEDRLRQKSTRSFRVGENQIKGVMSQILGTFELLNRYRHVALLSSPSKQASIDAIGVGGESVDFIEIKAGKGQLSPAEREVKRLIDAGKVRYVVMEARLPDDFEMVERKMRSLAPPEPEEEAFVSFQEEAGRSDSRSPV